MKKVRNLLANPKSQIARRVGLGAWIILPLILLICCGEPENTCEYEMDELNTAKTEETKLNDEFNANADSCINHYAPQMSEAFVNNAYGNLPNVASEPYTKQDSVNVLLIKANNVPEEYQDERVKGIIRTGNKALALYTNSIPVADSITQVKQKAFDDCQAQN